MANFSMSPVYLRDQKQDGSILAIGELVKRSNAWWRTRATAWVVDGIVTSIYSNNELQVCVWGLAQNPNWWAITIPWVDWDTVYQSTTNAREMATSGNVSVGKKYAGTMGDGYNEGLLFEVSFNKIPWSAFNQDDFTVWSIPTSSFNWYDIYNKNINIFTISWLPVIPWKTRWIKWNMNILHPSSANFINNWPYTIDYKISKNWSISVHPLAWVWFQWQAFDNIVTNTLATQVDLPFNKIINFWVSFPVSNWDIIWRNAQLTVKSSW